MVREVQSGYYSPLSYLLSKGALSIEYHKPDMFDTGSSCVEASLHFTLRCIWHLETASAENQLEASAVKKASLC
jgi:hypothetical protein